MTFKIAVVICSTRKPRVGPHVANYIKSAIDNGNTSEKIKYHLVDVDDFNLPIFDETVLPAMVPDKASYTKPHAIKWSAEMKQYAGFIFVTPEYNYGIPASTKNAVDFLYNEISGKPAIVASYGIYGGKSSNDSLRATLEGMKLKLVSEKVTLPFSGGPGPDMFAAVSGTLGEETKTLWENEHKKIILQAVDELEKKLEETQPTAS